MTHVATKKWKIFYEIKPRFTFYINSIQTPAEGLEKRNRLI